MDILKEKALLEAQKQVKITLSPEEQRDLEELKVSDPDTWYNKKRELEAKVEQEIARKAEELYSNYLKQQKLEETGLSEAELKQKLSVAEYEKFLATGELPDSLTKKEEPKDDNPSVPDITKAKGTNPTNNDEQKDFKKDYKQVVF